MGVSTDEKYRAKLVLNTDGEHEMIIDMTQIPIPQAAKAVQLPEPILRHLVSAGAVIGSGDLCDLESAAEISNQLAAARAPVEGQGILATDAAQKYGFNVVSFYKWQADGWITLLEDRRRGKIFNEGDIAMARKLADLVGHTAGRAVFPARPRSGRPRKIAS